MADEQNKDSGLEGLFGKAQDALGKFMDNPEHVDKAKAKAEGLLGKYMDPQKADELTNTAEGMLEKIAHKPSDATTEPET